MNTLTDPITLTIIGAIIVVATLAFINRTRIAAAGRALIAKPVLTEFGAAYHGLEQKFASAAKTDAEKAASFVGYEWHRHDPAAPAAPVADVTPPASAAQASAGDGGTTLVVTAADAVVNKHAQLDALIAAGVAAQAQKDALTANQAEQLRLIA